MMTAGVEKGPEGTMLVRWGPQPGKGSPYMDKLSGKDWSREASQLLLNLSQPKCFYLFHIEERTLLMNVVFFKFIFVFMKIGRSSCRGRV